MLSFSQFYTSKQRTFDLLNTVAPPSRQQRLILPQTAQAPSIPQVARQSQNTRRNDPLHFQIAGAAPTSSQNVPAVPLRPGLDSLVIISTQLGSFVMIWDDLG